MKVYKNVLCVNQKIKGGVWMQCVNKVWYHFFVLKDGQECL